MSSSSVEDGSKGQGVGAKGAGGSLLDAPSMRSNSGRDASHYSSHTGFSLLPDAPLLPIGAGCIACAHFMPMCVATQLLLGNRAPWHASHPLAFLSALMACICMLVSCSPYF